MHVLMEFRTSGIYEKQDMGISSKTEYVLFFFKKVGHTGLVLLG